VLDKGFFFVIQIVGSEEKPKERGEINMTVGETIVTLCREAGDQGDESDLLDGWTSNHSGCAHGIPGLADETKPDWLMQARLCTGLPLTT